MHPGGVKCKGIAHLSRRERHLGEYIKSLLDLVRAVTDEIAQVIDHAPGQIHGFFTPAEPALAQCHVEYHVGFIKGWQGMEPVKLVEVLLPERETALLDKDELPLHIREPVLSSKAYRKGWAALIKKTWDADPLRRHHTGSELEL
ncbi:MAG: hypothetical protein AB2L14_37955 [Candidatus Xenobiia bacterium LiM19]